MAASEEEVEESFAGKFVYLACLLVLSHVHVYDIMYVCVCVITRCKILSRLVKLLSSSLCVYVFLLKYPNNMNEKPPSQLLIACIRSANILQILTLQPGA